MLEALESLERAQLAEEDEARWLRVACWVARRVDGASSRVARRTRLLTRIDFGQTGAVVERDELEPLDLLEDDVPW